MIEFKDVNKYYGDFHALKNINLSFTKGEVTVVIGPSGSGKSTLLRCINHLEEPNSGKIIFNGEEVTKRNITKVREKIGMVFHQFNLFPNMSVLENLCLAPVTLGKLSKEEAKIKAIDLLGNIHLLDKKDAYPDSLSGGQKQRVAIARTLMMEPDIILFDEPTRALDPEMVGEVLDLIKMVASENKTMIIVSHEISFVKSIANRILFLENGKIIFDGSNKEFFNNKNDRIKAFLQKVKK